MKAYPECAPCMLRRALIFARDADEETQYRVVREVCRVFSEEFREGRTTTDMSYMRNKSIAGILGDDDSMRELKDRSMEVAEEIYPLLEAHVDGIADERERLKACLKIALAGNVLEFGAQDHKPDLERLEEQVFEIIRGPLAIDDFGEFYSKIKNSKEILYVTDNAAELVFDRILIKELKKYAKVCLAPLSKPVQDDATVKEVETAGLDSLCEVVPRSDHLGVWFDRCTKEFIEKWGEVDFIIVKGMGCYETLTEYPEKTRGKVGLLMKAKCNPVARNVGVPLGGAVMKIM